MPSRADILDSAGVGALVLAVVMAAGCTSAPSPTTSTPSSTPEASRVPVPVTVDASDQGAGLLPVTTEWRFEQGGVVVVSHRSEPPTAVDASPYEVQLLPARYDLVVSFRAASCRLGVGIHGPRTDLLVSFSVQGTDSLSCQVFDRVGSVLARCDPVPEPAPALTCAAAVTAALPASSFAASDVGDAEFHFGSYCPPPMPCASALPNAGYVAFFGHPGAGRPAVVVQVSSGPGGTVTVDSTQAFPSAMP